MSRLGRAAALSCCLLCLLGGASARAAEDEAAPLFRPDAIYAIDLQLPPASFKTLEDEPEVEYVEGTFSIAASDGSPDGVGPFSPPRMVGIRLKGGGGSFRALKDEKAAFKIKFNFENSKGEKGKKFLGLKKLTLNNMVQDASMLHETMAYEAFRALGVPAPRTGYANVYVNGVNYGVHLNVETYDDVSLPRHFASTQHLYEADAPGTDVRTGEQDSFEIDEGDPPATDLEVLIAAANDAVGDWSNGMAGVADLEEMARMWAVERYIGHWDGYAGVVEPVAPPVRPNNYYLHSEDSGLFSMLPWGTDQTWGMDVEFDEPSGGLLFNECLADASCDELYVEALRETQGAVAGLDLDAQAGCLAELLAPWQALEGADRREFDAEQIAEGVDEADEFLAARPDELSDWLETQPGAGEGAAVGPPAPCTLPSPPPPARSDSHTDATPPAPRQIVLSPAAHLKLLRFAVSGRRLRTVLDVDLPGVVRETATTAGKGGDSRVCSARRSVGAPGKVILGCALGKVARQRLHDGRLALDLILRFVPKTGAPESYAGHFDLPRRPPSS